MMLFCYAALMRPPGPGAVPREGLVCADCTEVAVGGRRAWGTVTYDRRLTDEEIEHYELEPFYGNKTKGDEKE